MPALHPWRCETSTMRRRGQRDKSFSRFLCYTFDSKMMLYRFFDRTQDLVWLVWLFICMGILLGINIITYIIHHPRSERYTLVASQLCAAWDSKIVFATFRSPPKHFLTRQEIFGDYTLACQHFYRCALKMFRVQHVEEVRVVPKLLSWIHFAHITSPVQRLCCVTLASRHFFSSCLVWIRYLKNVHAQNSTQPRCCGALCMTLVFILTSHFVLPPRCTHGAISTSASEVANLPLPVDNTMELWRWNRNLPFCQAVNRWEKY